MSRTRTINDIGIGLAGAVGEKMVDLRVYHESGNVLVWTEINCDGQSREVMQYLTPEEAMRFAAAFERCAIQALKDIAK